MSRGISVVFSACLSSMYRELQSISLSIFVSNLAMIAIKVSFSAKSYPRHSRGMFDLSVYKASLPSISAHVDEWKACWNWCSSNREIRYTVLEDVGFLKISLNTPLII